MGSLIIEQAISALKEAGFKTQRAYPGRKMAAITNVVAAVQMAQMDISGKKTELEILMLCPQDLGAEACEDGAITAAQALQTAGFHCKVGKASFDGTTGLFSVSCMALVQAAVSIPFKIGAVVQNRVVSFTAKRQMDAPPSSQGEGPWTVRVEQFFPAGTTQDSDPDGDQFTLTNGPEIYHGCAWTSHSRVTEADGTRQIREGTSMYRTIK